MFVLKAFSRSCCTEKVVLFVSGSHWTFHVSFDKTFDFQTKLTFYSFDSTHLMTKRNAKRCKTG